MIAASEIVYGSPVLIDGAYVHPCPIDRMQGVARRPHTSRDDRHYAKGEDVWVKTDGHIIMEVDRVARSVVLKHGRVVE